MAVKTPSYWDEEKFQPMVETTTLYGNKVKVPERFSDAWAFYHRRKREMLMKIEHLTADGLRQARACNKLNKDLQMVFYEIYEE